MGVSPTVAVAPAVADRKTMNSKLLLCLPLRLAPLLALLVPLLVLLPAPLLALLPVPPLSLLSSPPLLLPLPPAAVVQQLLAETLSCALGAAPVESAPRRSPPSADAPWS